MAELQIGDEVKIVGPDDFDSHAVETIGFNGEMRDLIGENGTITETLDVHGYTVYRVTPGDWVYVEEWLEPCNVVQPAFSEQDFESVFI